MFIGLMRTPWVIILLFSQFFFQSHAFAQDNKIDSLKKIIPGLTDTARIDAIRALGYAYLCAPKRDSVSILYYTNLLYEESKKINYIHGIAESYRLKAIIAELYGRDYFQSEQLARDAITWFDRTPNKRNIEYAYKTVAVALFLQYRYNEAFPYLKRWFYWSEKNGNKNEMYQELGFEYENYRDLGEYDKAFEAFEKSQQLNITLNGKKDTLSEFYTLAELQRRLGNYPAALNYYHKLVANKDLQHDNIWYRISYPELFALNGKFDSAQYYYNLIDTSQLSNDELAFYHASLGEFYLWQKKYDSAITPLLRGLEYYRKVNNINYQKRSLIDIAKTCSGLQKDNEALTYIREALDLSIRSHAKQYIRDCYEILYEIYQRKNEPDSAFAYYQKYVAQKEIVANDVVKGKFAAYNYEQQIALLDNEKIVQKQKLQREKTSRNILIGAFAIGLLLAVFLVRNIQLKRRKDKLQHLMTEANTQLDNRRKEQQLAEMQQQKAELEMQALRAQMNPHFIFNSLNSINMFILENNRLQASEYLSKFSRLVRLILQNSQEAFIPLERELEALKLYLELESLRFEKKFEYKISVDENVDATVLKVPPLVIQPYAENAIWHGLMHKKAKGHLEIELYIEEKNLFCKITDDGVGRKYAAELRQKSSLGHRSMGMRVTADRIAMVQQKSEKETHITVRDLVLADGSDGGTEVLLKIPATQ